nr:protein-disulfide reductase DsbD [Acinetobacter harbinensis]
MFSRIFMGAILTLSGTCLFANEDFLPPDQAFKFQASSTATDQVELQWTIAPEYYLYHDQFKVSVEQKDLALKLPKGQEKDDPTFGKTEVHYNQVVAQFAVQPNREYSVKWQGCSENGLCYPVQHRSIHTDAEGLLPQQNLAKSQSESVFLKPKKAAPASPVASATTADSELNLALTDPTLLKQPPVAKPEGIGAKQPIQTATSATQVSASAIEQKTVAPSPSTAASFNQELNNDLFFVDLLSNQNIFFNILIFLGLGVLLAFLPCSLPLIPILSGILIQRKKGYKASFIALTFILSMALVYGIMGVIVSQIGFNIQRWFQSPVFISLFALLFIVFALNLFGLYQLALPQKLLQRLDQIQQRQKGGTLLGAGVMGAVSALIVGPCMSAPLAGALLYVSHVEQKFLGGFYLFLLGVGIGIPLFIASVFGAKYLPKPGAWMDRLKFSFGFVMLAMAIYFARPLLPISLYFIAFAAVFLAMAIYLIRVVKHVATLPYKISVLILSALLAGSGLWQLNLAIANVNPVQNSQLQPWIIVNNSEQLQAALAAHSTQPVIIDVYADWCVACQPIEREVLPSARVQQAIQNVTRIKLDLTQYEPSQDVLLKQLQVLGPPTLLFLQPNQHERRNLRLTGTYTAAQLIENVQQLTASKGH